MSAETERPCALCARETPDEALAEAGWIDAETERRLAAEHPGWRRQDGACPACVQQALLLVLLERGEALTRNLSFQFLCPGIRDPRKVDED